MDDMDFEDDSLILDLDLTSLNVHIPTTQSFITHIPHQSTMPSISASIPIYQPHLAIQTSKSLGTPSNAVLVTQPIGPKDTRTFESIPKNHHIQTMSSTAIAAVSNVGMNVWVAASGNQLIQQTKKAKSQTINDMASTLRGYCVICWTWKGIFTQIIPGVQHQPFADCGKANHCDRKLPWGGGPTFFATKIDFKPHHFCWHCGLPQDVNHVQYRPSCHPQPAKGPCAFKGLTTGILFTLHQHPILWAIVKKKFGLKEELDKAEKFASWCQGYDENTANYWMGLEIVIWFWSEREKGHMINV